jgi:hypothetical protein
MKRASVLLIPTVLVLACESDAPPPGAVESCASALRVQQGESLQGTNLNGFAENGVNAQAIATNGFSPQGRSVQGISLQGISLNGFSQNGTDLNGFSENGTNLNGVTENGTNLNGVTENGVNWQGTSTDGIKGAGLAGARLALRAGVLELRMASGRVVSGQALVGLRLPAATSTGETVWLTVAGVEPAAGDPDLAYYALEYQGQSLCQDGAKGLFVAGIWDGSGARRQGAVAGGLDLDVTFSCPAGVIAKCVRWGYRPWAQGPALHEACTRMARADYCGDGVPHTRDGTLIDMFDGAGVQSRAGVDGFTFEAGWGPGGAVCVHEPRYRDSDGQGRALLPSCWAAKPRCEWWDEAAQLGALVANDSAHAPRMLSCKAP